MQAIRSCLCLSLVALPAASGMATSTGGYARALSAYTKKYGQVRPGTYYYREPKSLEASYKEMARIYGEDTAIQMVEDVPGALTFRGDNFQPTLDIFSEKFGEDTARAMVIRNPALLSVPPSGPDGADKADGKALVLSYVVAVTRPVGGLLLGILFTLLSIPAVEIVTGLPARQIVQDSIKGSLGL
jgi:hypothetical protein